MDLIAITHPDADHYNGLEYIFDHFSTETLWVRDVVGHDDMYKQLIQQTIEKKVDLYIPEKDQVLARGTDSLLCLANIHTGYKSRKRLQSRSNNGLVLKACSAHLCVLFPGDIDSREELGLVEQNIDLDAEVLLAAHHGSITSNSEHFLTAVSPRYLLVSAGRSRKEYFPHKGLTDKCKELGIKLMTTADQGTIKIIATSSGYRVYGYRKKDDNPLFSFTPVLLADEQFTPR